MITKWSTKLQRTKSAKACFGGRSCNFMSRQIHSDYKPWSPGEGFAAGDLRGKKRGEGWGGALTTGGKERRDALTAKRELCSGGIYEGRRKWRMVVAEIARGKKKGGDGCSGFCARTVDQTGRRCNGRGDCWWELAWVSQRIGGVTTSSPKLIWWRRGLEFLYLPTTRSRFDSIKFK